MSTFFDNNPMFSASKSCEMSLSDLESRLDSGDLYRPDYQRNLVWSLKQKQSYLDSLSKGYPLFGPVINLDMENGKQEIMDGQNRFHAIYGFMKDEFATEDGIKFSELSDIQKRLFRGLRITYLETQDWTEEDCEEFFTTMNQGGLKLKQGELIHADRANRFTTEIESLAEKYKSLFENPVSEGGLGLSKKNILRYQHYEIIGTILHMNRTEEFPIRPGVTALKESEIWKEHTDMSLLTDIVNMADNLLSVYQEYMKNVPRLNEKLAVTHHLRLLYFIMRYKTILNTPPVERYHRIDKLLTTILNRQTQAYKDTISWGTTDCMKIYDKYVELYHSA